MHGAAHDLRHVVASFPTPVLADVVVRLGLPVRQAPVGIRGPAGCAVAGRALPVRHAGSVEVFLEAIGAAEPGDVMVIDNGGRADEACIGDLVAHEARGAGVAGIVIWGLHRDAAEIGELGMPVFSYGTLPFGPRQVRADPDHRLTAAGFGPDTVVTQADFVAADGNGVLFLPTEALGAVASAAASIRAAEGRQVSLLRRGVSLREQLGFASFLQARGDDPSHTFRQHLRERSGAIEE